MIAIQNTTANEIVWILNADATGLVVAKRKGHVQVAVTRKFSDYDVYFGFNPIEINGLEIQPKICINTAQDETCKIDLKPGAYKGTFSIDGVDYSLTIVIYSYHIRHP